MRHANAEMIANAQKKTIADAMKIVKNAIVIAVVIAMTSFVIN